MRNKNSIRIQYLGCSAFVISDANGTPLAADLWTKGVFPYAEDTPEDLGLGEPPPFSALLVSHDHKDHSFVPPGVPIIYGVQSRKVDDTPSLCQVGNIAVGKFSSNHFGTDAKRPKLNTVFVLTVAGTKIVHLGDAHGTMADAARLRELRQKIGGMDLLLISVGSPWMKPVELDTLDQTITSYHRARSSRCTTGNWPIRLPSCPTYPGEAAGQLRSKTIPSNSPRIAGQRQPAHHQLLPGMSAGGIDQRDVIHKLEPSPLQRAFST